MVDVHVCARKNGVLLLLFGLLVMVFVVVPTIAEARTNKPILHGKHWVAITGKPLAATASSLIFQQGGNAVDSACAMLAATSTMFDVLSWGGEIQALIYNPNTKKVVAINALGVAPTGATPEFFRERGMQHPPEYGPLAAVTPGTPGGLLVMLREYGSRRRLIKTSLTRIFNWAPLQFRLPMQRAGWCR